MAGLKLVLSVSSASTSAPLSILLPRCTQSAIRHLNGLHRALRHSCCYRATQNTVHSDEMALWSQMDMSYGHYNVNTLNNKKLLESFEQSNAITGLRVHKRIISKWVEPQLT